MGEAKRRQKLALVPAAEAVSEAMCWMETPAGKPQVRWNGAGAVTPFGQMAFFNDFLNLSGLRAGLEGASPWRKTASTFKLPRKSLIRHWK
jgi:hypothetical protein